VFAPFPSRPSCCLLPHSLQEGSSPIPNFGWRCGSMALAPFRLAIFPLFFSLSWSASRMRFFLCLRNSISPIRSPTVIVVGIFHRSNPIATTGFGTWFGPPPPPLLDFFPSQLLSCFVEGLISACIFLGLPVVSPKPFGSVLFVFRSLLPPFFFAFALDLCEFASPKSCCLPRA